MIEKGQESSDLSLNIVRIYIIGKQNDKNDNNENIWSYLIKKKKSII